MKRSFIILALGALVIAGCHRGDRTSPVRRDTPRMRDVSGREFELEYFAPRTPLNQWRYRGVVDGFHVLDYYGRPAAGEEAEYYYSIRTQTYNLPKDFPSKPQPVVKTFLTKEDEQYLDNIGREKLIDRQRRGESSW